MATLNIFRGSLPVPSPVHTPIVDPFVGKSVLWKTEGGSDVAGIVTAKHDGSSYTVALAVPNDDGLLVKAQDTLLVLPTDRLTTLDIEVLDGRDVKLWNAKEPLQDVTAKPVRDGDRIIDYVDVRFEGYGSTFQSTTPADRGGDYILPGAFNQSLGRFKENSVMIVDHERMVRRMMGHYERVGVNSRGLSLRGSVTNSTTEDARHVRFLLVEGSLKTLSMGGIFHYLDDRQGIERVDLHEVSLVVVPMNPDCSLTVRSLSEEAASKALTGHMERNGGEIRVKAA